MPSARTRTCEARSSLVDEGPSRQMEEHVLERRPAHERALGIDAELVDAVRREVAVVRVQHEPAAQNLDAPREPVDAVRQVGRRLLRREAELDDLTCGIAADQLDRRPLRGDLALVHDDESVAELLGLVHVCVVSSSVAPACLRAWRRSQTTWRACGSRPVVGSSSKRMSGSLISERAIVKRRFIPPDSGSTLESMRSSSCTNSSRRSARSWRTLREIPK